MVTAASAARMRALVFFSLLACETPASRLQAFDSAAQGAQTAELPPLAVPAFRVYSPSQLAFVDAQVMLDDLAAQPLVFFGERHETAPVQALEGWVLDGLLARRGFTLAMEHFDRDVQPALDAYLAGGDLSVFLAASRPWKNFSHYWLPLVDRMKGSRVQALNVPRASLNNIYAQFPSWPLDAVAASPFLPALPLPAWAPIYAQHFADSFDYEAHQMGLSYDEALRYFTELAHLRDMTMAEPLTQEGTFVVQGEWHVAAGIATPSHVALSYKVVTTAPESETSDFTTRGRWVADYVLVYR